MEARSYLGTIFDTQILCLTMFVFTNNHNNTDRRNSWKTAVQVGPCPPLADDARAVLVFPLELICADLLATWVYRGLTWTCNRLLATPRTSRPSSSASYRNVSIYPDDLNDLNGPQHQHDADYPV